MDPTSPQAAAAAAAAAQQEFEQEFGRFPAPAAEDAGRSANLFFSLVVLVVVIIFFGPAYLRHMLLSRHFRYVGRSGSLAEYRRDGAGGVASAARQLASLPWFARNLVLKAAIAAGLRKGPWPY